MTIRYSGECKVRIVWEDGYRGFNDRRGGWRCNVSDRDGLRATFYVGRSASGSDTLITANSPEGYDDAARSAFGMANAEGLAYNADLSVVHVGRSKETAWPKEGA